MWEVLKNILDTFGSGIFVPIVLFIIAKTMKMKTNKAIVVALNAAVGLAGFSMITGNFTSTLSPVIQQLVEKIGINLPGLDIGWQAAASVAYSTEIGMIWIGGAILLQLFLFFIKWTNIFSPSDLWNNYSYIIWGSLIYIATHNIVLAISCMVFGNLVCLLFAEVIQKRWSTYYGYPQCTITAPHHVAEVPIVLGIDVLLNKIGLGKVKLRPDTLQKKIGFLGEPMAIGFVVGFLIGFISNIYMLDSLQAWGTIMQVAVTTSMTMAIFPKVAGIFANAFTSIADASRKSSKGRGKDEWYMSVNDALGYGEPATLTTGLLLIPIMLVLMVFLPGNIVMPIMSLTSFPYRMELTTCISNGNILKGIINGAVLLSLQLIMASSNAELFTKVASSIGFTVPQEAIFIIALPVGTVGLGLIYKIFMTQNYFFIGIMIVAYFVLYYFIKKNMPTIHEFLEKNASGNWTDIDDISLNNQTLKK